MYKTKKPEAAREKTLDSSVLAVLLTEKTKQFSFSFKPYKSDNHNVLESGNIWENCGSISGWEVGSYAATVADFCRWIVGLNRG